MKHSRVYWLTCLLLLAAFAASATTIVMPSDEQLVAKSPVIVEGTVLRSVAVDRGEGSIWTETTLRVDRLIKGQAAGTITIAEMGGVVGERFTKIYGAPEYTEGERVLVFVRPENNGQYRTVDLFIGKFTEEHTIGGQRLWFRPDGEAEASLLDSNLNELAANNIQRDANGFDAFVAARVAGRAAVKNYGVENPAMKSGTRGGRFGGPQANFTLISEPTIYRWRRFENNQSANWVAHGQQTGYSGGGVSELQTAMSAWNNAPQANIRYSYSGAASGQPGGLTSPNGINEVMFNDPRNEIAGTFSPTEGGVIGQGGFNGVTNGGAWTSPFGADAQHVAGTYSSLALLEGNLTIQDGVSPSAGLNSSRLAELIAHELGHTLGFGHSDDSSALMYFRITGLGSSLRADDQLAARWLYPGAGITPPPPTPVPNAPSNLSATANASQIFLQWTDNADNETGFSVYLAVGNANFTNVGSVSANVRSATISGLSAGAHRVYVVATNSSGTSTPSNTVNVTVGSTTPPTPVPPTASFTVSPSAGVAGVTNFSFNDQSSGTITAWLWSFGDNTSATTQDATHIYANAGVYTVSLRVTGAGTSSTTTRTVVVTGPLNAAFTYSPQNPTVNDNISFSDQSTGGVTSWLWTFGDGTSSSDQNPTKRYVVAGVYNVLLTVFRNAETKVATAAITVTDPSPILPPVSASFDLNTPQVKVATPITFTDTSSGSPDRWSWSFGDGGLSTAKNPTHTYAAPGTYTVTLTAGNAFSSSTSSRPITVTASLEPFRSLISATAQTSGIGGSVWRTELSLFNAGNESASVELIFIPGAGGAVQTRNLFLAPKQLASYANALLDVFGMPSGVGALAIEATSATSSPDLRISSRTFTNGTVGTYGQQVPAVSSEGLVQTTYLTGLASNDSFRTNIGAVNRSSNSVPVTLTLFESDGNEVGSASFSVPGNSFGQTGLTQHFPQLAGRSLDTLSMRISASQADAVSVYASIVDNRTQDPVYYQASGTPEGDSLIVPAVGRAPGANGTFWRSDVTLFNPTSTRMILGIRYLVAGADNRNASTSTLSLNAGRTFVLADVLNELGLQSGSGALEVTWTGESGPVVTSRTYTSVESGGTYGQSIDPIVSYGRDVYVPGLRSDTSFRTNVGFVNGSQETIGINVTLISSTGSTIATGFLQLAPKSQTQTSVSGLFPGLNAAAIGTFTLHAHTDGAPMLFAYGSIVDNASGDPAFFKGE